MPDEPTTKRYILHTPEGELSTPSLTAVTEAARKADSQHMPWYVILESRQVVTDLVRERL